MMMTVDDQAPRAARADARRRHLLEVARALFVTHGFHQTGMAQIAAVSGIKVGQIYRDFASKEEITAAIVEEDVASWLLEDELALAMANDDGTAIRDWIRRFGVVEESLDECRMMTEIIAEAGRNERIAEIYHDIDVRVRSSLMAALEALAPAPDRACERTLLAELIIALSMGLMTRRILSPDIEIAAMSRLATALVDRELAALARAGA